MREDTVESRLYNRLLVRLLAVPVATLTVLAIILGYGLERVQESATAVDRADVVIQHANSLIKLIVDEETGVRGYLLVQDPAFLQPLHQADQNIEPEFNALFDLVHRPDLVDRLHRLQNSHQQWERQAYQEINSPPQDPLAMEQHMLQRKQEMDDLRAQIDEFVSIVAGRRAEHSSETESSTATPGLFSSLSSLRSRPCW